MQHVQGEVDNDVDLLTEEENEPEPQPPVPLRRAFECISELRSFFLENGFDDYSLEMIEQQVAKNVIKPRMIQKFPTFCSDLFKIKSFVYVFEKLA